MSSILSKKFQWDKDNIQLYYTDVNFHLFSGLGAFISFLINFKKLKENLILSIFLIFLSLFATFFLFNVEDFFFYNNIFSLMCIANGHMENFSLNFMIKKFDEKKRALIFAYVYFFNQLGKFLFAKVIYDYKEKLKNPLKADIDFAIYPIFIFFLLQFFFIFLVVHYINWKGYLKLILRKEKFYYKNENDLENFLENEVSELNNSGEFKEINDTNEKKFENENNLIDEEYIYDNNFHSFYEYIKKGILSLGKYFSFKEKEINSKNEELGYLRKNKIIYIENYNNKNYNDSNVINKSKECFDDTENRQYLKNKESKEVKENSFTEINVESPENSNLNIYTRQRKISKDFYSFEIEEKNPQNHNNFISSSLSKINSIKENYNKSYIKLKIQSLSELFQSKIFYHQLKLIILNFSLGISFYSLLNIFPHFNYHFTYVDVIDEIFYSKKIHTILLFFFPLIFLIKKINRKNLLIISFFCNLIINFQVLFNYIHSRAFVHFFRFVWNVCFITVNLYSVEASPKKIRNLNSSFLIILFHLSSIFEIFVIEDLIGFDIYFPVLANIALLTFDIFLICGIKYETHMKSLDDLEKEFDI